jgi:hypothetical protein
MTAGPKGSHTGITFTKDFTSCKSSSNILIQNADEMQMRMIDATKQTSRFLFILGTSVPDLS